MFKVVEKPMSEMSVGDVVVSYGKLLEKTLAVREGRFDVKFENGTSLNIHGNAVWNVIVQA
jgi:hypothetical protein